MSSRRPVTALDLAGRLTVRVSELGALLGVSENVARRIVPELQAVYIEGVRLIPVAEVQRWIRDQMREERERTTTGLAERS